MEEMPISTLATPNMAWREAFSSSIIKEQYSKYGWGKEGIGHSKIELAKKVFDL